MHSALIIDDDTDYRVLIAELLRADGWQVWDADSGERGDNGITAFYNTLDRFHQR